MTGTARSRRTVTKLLLALLVLAILAIPMLACGEDSGWTAPVLEPIETAEAHTEKANGCSQECDGVQSCIETCVNK